MSDAKPNPTVSVLIVAYKSGPHLRGCLDALEAQTFRDFEVLLVDNNPADGSVMALAPLPSWVKVLPQSVNTGFATANNLAAVKARGRWLALLNPDTVAAPEWLATLMAATARYPNVNIFASTQIKAEDPGRLDGAGDLYSPLFGLAWRGGRGAPLARAAEDGEVFGPCGAAALYRRRTFLSDGGFEEGFFCYYEDVDLAFRMRLAGERCFLVRDAVVHHVGSEPSQFSVHQITRNRIWTYLRCMPAGLLWPLLPFFLAPLVLRLIMAPFGPTNRHRARAIQDSMISLGTIWRQRREIQANRRSSLIDLARAFTWSPIALLRRDVDLRPIRSTDIKKPAEISHDRR
jgi:GT2 family glycosyltransferase